MIDWERSSYISAYEKCNYFQEYMTDSTGDTAPICPRVSPSPFPWILYACNFNSIKSWRSEPFPRETIPLTNRSHCEGIFTDNYLATFFLNFFPLAYYESWKWANEEVAMSACDPQDGRWAPVTPTGHVSCTCCTLESDFRQASWLPRACFSRDAEESGKWLFPGCPSSWAGLSITQQDAVLHPGNTMQPLDLSHPRQRSAHAKFLLLSYVSPARYLRFLQSHK